MLNIYIVERFVRSMNNFFFELAVAKENHLNLHLRAIATRFSTSGFFHESASPKPLSIPLGPLKKFSKI
jgi:hypothetical protein